MEAPTATPCAAGGAATAAAVAAGTPSAAARSAADREALRLVVQQWNANRLDIFALSEPNEVRGTRRPTGTGPKVTSETHNQPQNTEERPSYPFLLVPSWSPRDPLVGARCLGPDEGSRFDGTFKSRGSKRVVSLFWWALISILMRENLFETCVS